MARSGDSFTFAPIPDATNGLTRVYTNAVKGIRAGRTIRGTPTAGFTETETATGQMVRTCTSGPVKFVATD